MGFALPRLMMFVVAASVLLSSPLWRSLIQCLSHKFISVFPPLCTSAHFQHSQLQSCEKKVSLGDMISQHPLSLYNTDASFELFFAGIVRDIVGSDNIWQIDEVNVWFPNFSLIGDFIEQILLYFLLICPFIICISLPKRDKGHTQLE